MATGDNIIKVLREQKGLKQNELAQQIGVHKSAIHLYEKGTRMPREKVLVKLAAALNISEADLYNQLLTYHSSATADETPLTRIILYSKIVAGQSTFSVSEIEGYITTTYSYNADNHFALRVHGNKMSGSCLPDNAIVIVKRQSYIEDGRIAVIRVNDGDGIIGHLYHNDKSLIMKFSDKKSKDLTVNLLENHVDIIGRAVGFQGEFK